MSDNYEGFQHLIGSIPEEGAKRLESLLKRIETGFNIDLRTPLYDSAPRENIIKMLEQRIGVTGFKEMDEIDEHEKSKIGSFSIMLPAKERRSNLSEYWSQSWNPDEAAIANAVDHVKSILPLRSLRPASFDTAFNLMPKDTSLGLPWMSRNREFVSDYMRRAQTLKESTDIYPCVWYWRGQPKGLREVPKQRDVWGFDHAETIAGARILYPLLSALRQRPGFAAWLGDSFVDVEATQLLKMSHGRQIISMDYSGFDSSLSVYLLNLVDDIIRGWFIESVTPLITLLGNVANTIPIVVPYTILSGRNGGMPSGSVLTNMRDTLANLVAMYYCGSRLGVEVVARESLGDDSVVLYSDEVDPSDLSSIMSEIGLDVSAEKQFISRRSIHYLQRWHSLDYIRDNLCVGVHSPYRTLSGMLGYERFRPNWSKFMDSSRWIMQVENVRHDPRFREFVHFLIEGDDLLKSGMDPATIFSRAGGANEIRTVLDIASFPFNVKNPERVNEFETTRVIRDFQDNAR